MTVAKFWIVRAMNNGTMFKPQMVRTLTKKHDHFYTYESCLEECEALNARVLESLKRIEGLKLELATLESKKRAMVEAGVHPESNKLYKKFPVIGWSEATLQFHPVLIQFGWNGFRERVLSIRIEATDRIKKGFVYDIKLPAGAIECYVVIDGKKAIAPIRKGRVKILHIDQKEMEIFVRCERVMGGSWTGRFSGTDSNHSLDAIRYVLSHGGIQCGKTVLNDEMFKFIGQCFVHNIPLPVAIKGLI